MKVSSIGLGIIIILYIAPSCQKRAQITLTLYNHYDVAAPDTRRWEVIYNAFRERYPEIELVVEDGFDDRYHKKLETLAKTDQLADVLKFWPYQNTDYFDKKGIFKNLQPELKGLEDEFKPYTLLPRGPEGEIYELPESIQVCHVLYTNDKLLKQLNLSFPATFEELIEQGPIIREAGLIPIAMSMDGEQIQFSLLSTVMERICGISWWDNVVAGSDASFADPGFIKALSVIKVLNDNAMFAADLNEDGGEKALEHFVREQSVYYIDGGWQTFALATALTNAQKEYISYNALPDFEEQKGDSGSTAIVTGTRFAINDRLTGEKAEAAWQWLWFNIGPEGASLNQTFGLIPSYNVPISDEISLLNRKHLEFAVKSPKGPVIDDIMDRKGVADILERDIEQILSGTITCRQAAINYEAWVSKYDSNRIY